MKEKEIKGESDSKEREREGRVLVGKTKKDLEREVKRGKRKERARDEGREIRRENSD